MTAQPYHQLHGGDYVKLPAASERVQPEVKTPTSPQQQSEQQTTSGQQTWPESSTGRQHQKLHSARLGTFSRNPQSISSSSSFKRPLLVLTIAIIILLSLLNGGAGVVVHQVRFIAGKSGRQDYALAGESLELSCHYIMKDAAEEVKQLVWSKDGKNFLRWRKNKPGLEVLSYTYKGHLDPSSQHSRLIIHNVTTAMHGRYKCLVRTDLGIHQAEQQLTVISQSHCKLSDWRVLSRPAQCSETFQLDCRNMFPKPVPSCGLWNNKSDKFIRSVVVDISEESRSNLNSLAATNSRNSNSNSTPLLTGGGGGGDWQETFRIRHVSKFELSPSSDLLQYAGHLVFKCYISVPDTSWRLSLVTPMFHYDDACLEDPLDTIERMRSNYSHYTSTHLQLMHNNPRPAAATATSSHVAPSFKMLSSDLNYELLGPLPDPHNLAPAFGESLNGSAHRTLASLRRALGKPKLNCWQKPVRGSIASLSCANKASHIRLVGTSILQCKESGWVPLAIQSLASNSEKAKSKTAAAAVGRRQQLALRRVSTMEYPDDDSSDEPSSGIINELEEHTTTTSPQTTEFEFIPTANVKQQQQEDEGNQLTGFEPATSLPTTTANLPTCVSMRRPPDTTETTGNKLPLLEGFSLNSVQKIPKAGSSWLSFSSNAPPIEPSIMMKMMALFLTSFLTLILHLDTTRNHYHHLLQPNSNRPI